MKLLKIAPSSLSLILQCPGRLLSLSLCGDQMAPTQPSPSSLLFSRVRHRGLPPSFLDFLRNSPQAHASLFCLIVGSPKGRSSLLVSHWPQSSRACRCSPQRGSPSLLPCLSITFTASGGWQGPPLSLTQLSAAGSLCLLLSLSLSRQRAAPKALLCSAAHKRRHTGPVSPYALLKN